MHHIVFWPNECVIMGLNDATDLFVFIQGTGKWYEMQDLQVTDILPQMITLSEAYIQASPPTHSVHVGKCKSLGSILFRATWNEIKIHHLSSDGIHSTLVFLSIFKGKSTAQ